MDFSVLLLICIIYGIVMFIDFFFKSCMMLPYLDFLRNSGLSVGFFSLKIHTNAFNRFITRHSSKLPQIYKSSFKLGFYVTMGVLFPISLCLIAMSLFAEQPSSPSSSSSSTAIHSMSQPKSDEVAHLEILLPGVNLPLDQIGYYLLSLLICSVVHEAGHGIASVLEDIPVSGFGMKIVFILPIAYTQIDTEHLQSARAWKKLKILSAGIWNNVLLASSCYALLLALPVIFMPVFSSKEAVFITKIKQNAPIKGENGLYVGDSVYQINGCSVTNEDEWEECLTESLLHHPAYCVNEEFVHENDESIQEIDHKDGNINCCSKSNPAVNCFESFDEERLPQYVCLNIRKTIEHAKNYCHKTTTCPEHVSCVKPLMANTTTIIHIKRKNRLKDFVYYGHPILDILYTVDVSRFIPKTKVLSPAFADSIALLLKYLIVFSSGLALVNVIPCYGLDGYLIVNTIISNLPSRYFSKMKKEIISICINLIGTITLFVLILKILWMTFL